MAACGCGGVDLDQAVYRVVLVAADGGCVADFAQSADGVVLVADALAGFGDGADSAACVVADGGDLAFAVGRADRAA